MSAFPSNRLSVEENLAAERTTNHRHEFEHGEVFAMAGEPKGIIKLPETLPTCLKAIQIIKLLIQHKVREFV